MAHVLATVRARVGRLLARRHLEPADDTAPADPLAEASPVLAGLASASVRGRVALGARVRRLGDEPHLGHIISRGPRRAQLDGFDLHANVWVPPNNRARLERVGWADLQKVEVVTTGDGPFAPDVFWVLHGTDGGCAVPQGASGDSQFFERLQALPGFDNDALIEAMNV